MTNEKLEQNIDEIKNLLNTLEDVNHDLVDACTIQDFIAGYMHGSMTAIEKVLKILED